MFGVHESEAIASKAVVSNGILPRYVEPKQPPTKKRPYSTIMSQPFTHTAQVTMPEELYQLISHEIESNFSNLQYSRVYMRLQDLLEGDFFTSYIKIGNIIMLSEGRPGLDDKYFFNNGQLRLDLAKENYERSGMIGKPIRDGGRKHMKTRYSVEIDLRQPSMLHGKKGFERIVWAFKNVLNHSVAWLVHDLERSSDATEERPIAQHHPMTSTCLPTQVITQRILLPILDPTKAVAIQERFADWACDTYEWLSLVAMASPRVQKDDSIDPFLSRYEIPEGDVTMTENLITLTWTGLLPPQWLRALFIHLSAVCHSRKSKKVKCFFAMSAYNFLTEVIDQRDGYTILWLPGGIDGENFSASTQEVSTQGDGEGYGQRFILWEMIC